MDDVKKQLELLRLEIPYLAKTIVDKQYDLQPEFEKYGPRGMQHSIDDAKSNLEYLFSAVEFESKVIFEEYTMWLGGLFKNLKLPVKTAENFFTCAREVFLQRFSDKLMGPNLFDKLTEYIDYGLNVLAKDSIGVEPVAGKENPFSHMLKDYSDAVFAGDKNRIASIIKAASKDGMRIGDIYRWVMEPFQRELGRLWHNNRINVGQEHYATALSQYAMSLLYERIFATPKSGGVFLSTCVQGELHEFGIRMVSDYMESCGWDTVYLGANMPDGGIINMIEEKKPDVVAVSCTMYFNISKVERLVKTIKDAGIVTPVMVGGYPFQYDPLLWVKVGADGTSGDFEEAYRLSEKIFQSDL